MIKLKLYSRIECPLCEYAEELLQADGVPYDVVDIDDDEALIQQYHVRIPVLSNGNHELDWPFDSRSAKELLEDVDHG